MKTKKAVWKTRWKNTFLDWVQFLPSFRFASSSSAFNSSFFIWSTLTSFVSWLIVNACSSIRSYVAFLTSSVNDADESSSPKSLYLSIAKIASTIAINADIMNNLESMIVDYFETSVSLKTLFLVDALIILQRLFFYVFSTDKLSDNSGCNHLNREGRFSEILLNALKRKKKTFFRIAIPLKVQIFCKIAPTM